MDEEGRSAQEWTKIILRRVLFLGGPIAVYCAFLLCLWFVYPPETGLIGAPSQDYLTLFGLFVAYLIPPFGKESIIPIALGFGYPIWIICFVRSSGEDSVCRGSHPQVYGRGKQYS